MTDTSLRHMLRQSLATFETRIDPADTVASVDMPFSLDPAQREDENPLIRRLCLRLLTALDCPVSENESTLSQERVTSQAEKMIQLALSFDSLYADKQLTPQQSSGVRDAAIVLYRLSIALAPTPKACNNIAVLYADAEDENAALEWLERGLELFPGDKTLRSNFDLFNEEDTD